MKASLILLILGAFFALCYGAAQEVGPTPCGVEVPTVETDAFNPRETWSNGEKNFTVWEHRFNWFTSSAPYTIYDILVSSSPYDDSSELVNLWELEPVSGHAGYYRFPAWRREWGLTGPNTHHFGYITKSSPLPLMLTFDIVKYTCSKGFEIEF